MTYIGCQRIVANATVRTLADLTVPARTTHVEIQADGNNIRYTMDNATPAGPTGGMIFLTTQPPKLFLIDDLRRIRFAWAAAGAGAHLNLHYITGRDV